MPRKKLTYEYVKNYIEQTECELRSDKYKNAHEKLEIVCSQGHIYQMTWANFQQGQRCPICFKRKHDNLIKHTYEYVKQYIENRGELLLSEEYKNNNTKLKFQCPKGHIYWMTFRNFKQGHRCPECMGNKKYTNQEIIETLQLYENIRENNDGEIEVTCKNCEEWFIPERNQLLRRMSYINGKTNKEFNMYCSQECKDICPIYGQHYYPKYSKPYLDREVQPELRQLVFERDNYICQKCGWHRDELDVGLNCHHIWPLNESPITSADIDECETLCEKCHKEIHMTVPGCGYGEMRCIY